MEVGVKSEVYWKLIYDLCSLAEKIHINGIKINNIVSFITERNLVVKTVEK